jgi:hypothetical protein
MTGRCAGCGRIADRYAKFNPDILICTPCTKILPGIQTRELKGINDRRCAGCDSTLFHGESVCCFCRHDIYDYVLGLGEELHNDNPFLFEITLPFIRFSQGLNLSEPSTGEDWIRYWSKRQSGWVTISFAGLIYENETST